jgi:hypothetical protein
LDQSWSKNSTSRPSAAKNPLLAATLQLIVHNTPGVFAALNFNRGAVVLEVSSVARQTQNCDHHPARPVRIGNSPPLPRQESLSTEIVVACDHLEPIAFDL